MSFNPKMYVFTALTAFVAASSALNILLSNDDGFASAQLVETQRQLKAKGHNVITVAPVDNESGQGGRAVFTTNKTLSVASEFGIVSAGSPSLGRSPFDQDVWYYNGTPAACIFVALDYVIPNYYNNQTIDLLVAGPNFGLNLGPFLYTLSGTMGATYAGIGRGLPGIAFSGGNGEQRSYTWINQTTQSGAADPAVIQAQLAVNLVTQLVNNTKPGQRILPLGYGISVNTPAISSLTNTSCVSPPFIQTRLTGGAFTDKAVYNSTSGLFTYGNIVGPGINRCINGDCSLPGETAVVGAGCYSAVSVFTIDYDAPSGKDQDSIRNALKPLVGNQNGHYIRDVRDLENTFPIHGGSF